jgi:hypothetical protein
MRLVGYASGLHGKRVDSIFIPCHLRAVPLHGEVACITFIPWRIIPSVHVHLIWCEVTIQCMLLA